MLGLTQAIGLYTLLYATVFTLIGVPDVPAMPQTPMSGYAALTRPTLKGKPDVAQRLCGSLQVDIEKTRRLLGWPRAFVKRFFPTLGLFMLIEARK